MALRLGLMRLLFYCTTGEAVIQGTRSTFFVRWVGNLFRYQGGKPYLSQGYGLTKEKPSEELGLVIEDICNQSTNHFTSSSVNFK